MCYSAESSLNSFIIGTIASIYLLNTKSDVNKHIGVVFITVCLMQFLEYLMWIDQKCGSLNNFASKMVTIVLLSQTLAIVLGGYLFNTVIVSKTILYYISIFIIALIVANLYNNFVYDKRKWCSKKNKYNNLEWDKYDEIWYIIKIIYCLIVLGYPFLLSIEKWKGILVAFTGFITLLYTKMTLSPSGSRWCYFAAYTPVLFCILDVLQKVKY
jgi:hypothetical protein